MKKQPLSLVTRRKNRVLFIILLTLVALFFGLSMVRLQENVHGDHGSSFALHP